MVTNPQGAMIRRFVRYGVVFVFFVAIVGIVIPQWVTGVIFIARRDVSSRIGDFRYYISGYLSMVWKMGDSFGRDGPPGETGFLEPAIRYFYRFAPLWLKSHHWNLPTCVGLVSYAGRISPHTYRPRM